MMGSAAAAVLAGSLILGDLALLSGSAAAQLEPTSDKLDTCAFEDGGLRWDLSPWSGVTLHSAGGVDLAAFSLSLCGDLAQPCVDSLTGVKLNGSAFSYFGDGPGPHPKLKCWDVVARWPPASATTVNTSSTGKPATALQLVFSHPFDPHLGCDTVTATTTISCDPGNPGTTMAGHQVSGTCDWVFTVKSNSTNICHPKRTERPTVADGAMGRGAAADTGGRLRQRLGQGDQKHLHPDPRTGRNVGGVPRLGRSVGDDSLGTGGTGDGGVWQHRGGH